MTKPENSLEARLTPRLRLFLSADIVGSTAYKNKTRTGEDGETASVRVQPWLKTFNRFYEDLPRSFDRRYQQIDPGCRLKAPRLWKTLGDEIVFEVVLGMRTQAESHLERFRETLQAYRSVLKDADAELDIKGTAWVAGFPVGNSIVKLTDIQGGEPWDDFIGPSMDIGFRLKDFASPRRIAVSIELAYLLASAKDHDDDGDFELHLADAIPLKGVINRKPYPAFWIESKGSGEDDDLASLERPLRSPARRHEIRAYCQAFIRMHSPPLFLPFIEKDPDFCTKPDGYASDLEDISKTWREFTSGEEPKSDQDAGPPQPINERLDELDELETSSD